MHLRGIILGLILFACLACWQRQEHDILPPEIPHYTLSGYTVDIDDTTQVIPHTPVSLTAYMLIYDATFDPVSVQADSNGYYQIESVIPGDYFLTAKRDGFIVSTDKLSIAHNDRVYNFELPSPLVNDYSYVSTAPLTGLITFVNGAPMALGYYSISETVAVPAILKLEIDQGLATATSYYPIDNLDADVFGYARGLFYLCKYAHVTVLSSIDGSVITDWVADKPLSGLTWSDSGFWTTHEHFLQFRGSDLSTVELSYETSAGRLKQITESGGYFWTYDGDRGLILKLDAKGNILTSYVPIDDENHQGIYVQDMEFRSEGMLYVAGGRKLFLFLTDSL